MRPNPANRAPSNSVRLACQERVPIPAREQEHGLGCAGAGLFHPDPGAERFGGLAPSRGQPLRPQRRDPDRMRRTAARARRGRPGRKTWWRNRKLGSARATTGGDVSDRGARQFRARLKEGTFDNLPVVRAGIFRAVSVGWGCNATSFRHAAGSASRAGGHYVKRRNATRIKTASGSASGAQAVISPLSVPEAAQRARSQGRPERCPYPPRWNGPASSIGYVRRMPPGKSRNAKAPRPLRLLELATPVVQAYVCRH